MIVNIIMKKMSSDEQNVLTLLDSDEPYNQYLGLVLAKTQLNWGVEEISNILIDEILSGSDQIEMYTVENKLYTLGNVIGIHTSISTMWDGIDCYNDDIDEDKIVHLSKVHFNVEDLLFEFFDLLKIELKKVLKEI
jgi:hypothetical protein